MEDGQEVVGRPPLVVDGPYYDFFQLKSCLYVFRQKVWRVVVACVHLCQLNDEMLVQSNSEPNK